MVVDLLQTEVQLRLTPVHSRYPAVGQHQMRGQQCGSLFTILPRFDGLGNNLREARESNRPYVTRHINPGSDMELSWISRY